MYVSATLFAQILEMLVSGFDREIENHDWASSCLLKSLRTNGKAVI